MTELKYVFMEIEELSKPGRKHRMFTYVFQANLRSAAYEALMEMIKNSPRDCYATVQRMTLIILERLNQVLVLEGQVQNSNDRAQVTDLQGLLCATLQVAMMNLLIKNEKRKNISCSVV